MEGNEANGSCLPRALRRPYSCCRPSLDPRCDSKRVAPLEPCLRQPHPLHRGRGSAFLLHYDLSSEIVSEVLERVRPPLVMWPRSTSISKMSTVRCNGSRARSSSRRAGGPERFGETSGSVNASNIGSRSGIERHRAGDYGSGSSPCLTAFVDQVQIIDQKPLLCHREVTGEEFDSLSSSANSLALRCA